MKPWAVTPTCENDYAVRRDFPLTAFSTCTLLCRRAKISPSVWRLPNAHCICCTVTLFDSTGIALQDLTSAAKILTAAEQAEVGVSLNF